VIKKIYKTSEFALLLGVSVKTLQRWDIEKALVAYRSPKGRRYYTHQQYLQYFNQKQASKISDHA